MWRTRTRWIIALLIVGGAGAAGAIAQEPVDPAVNQVILRQLATFRAGDYRAAYAFASREIQARFDVEAFEQMVKAGYPQIARSTHAWVTAARSTPNGALHVSVCIRGADGTFTGISEMNHSSLPPMRLSEPRALQPAVPPVRYR